MALHRIRRRGGRPRLARERSATQSLHGPEIAAGRARRRAATDYRDVVLDARLREALARLNPDAARRGAGRRLPQADARPKAPSLDRAQPRRAPPAGRRRDGRVPRAPTARSRGAQARVIDFDDPANNDWLAVNQFTVVEDKHTRRPDVVLFVNGLPLAVIELKNAADENATIWTRLPPAPDLPGADPGAVRLQRGAGRLRRRAGAHRHARRRQGVVQALAHDRRARAMRRAQLPELQVRARGRLRASAASSTCVRHFIVFEDDGGGKLAKKMAGYHQFHAVNVAVEETLRAARAAPRDRVAETPGRYEAGTQPGGEPGDRRVGVVWHTQGSGKSLTMAFYAGRVILRPGDGEPDDRRAHRPQRPRRPALRHLRPLPATCCASRRCRPPSRADLRAKLLASPPAAWSSRRSRSSSPRRRATGTRCSPTGATSSSSPTRRTAASTTSSTASRATCATRCRTPRSSASPARRSSRPTPTRAPSSATTSASTTSSAPSQDGATVPIYYESRLAKLELERVRAAEDRPGVRGGDRGRGGRAQGEAQDQVGAARGRGRLREAPRADRPRPRRALREPARGDGRQGDDRLHEPPHLRRAVPRDRRAAARTGTATTTTRARSRS